MKSESHNVLAIFIIFLWINFVVCNIISKNIITNGPISQPAKTRISEYIQKSENRLAADTALIAEDISYAKPLRQYTEIPRSNKLNSGVNLNQRPSIKMWCNIGEQSIATEKIKECYFRSPDNRQYRITEEGKLYSYAQDKNTTMTNADNDNWLHSTDSNIIIIFPRNRRSCELTIQEASETDSGKWTCKIVLSDTKQFQAATLNIPSMKENKDYSSLIRDVRLPTNLEPERYNVYLTPFIIKDNYTIEGHVDIMVAVRETTSKVILHIKEIQIYENSVRVENRKVLGHGYDEAREFYIIYLNEELNPAYNYKVSIDFLAKLNGDLSGFYRSSYFDKESGTTKFMAVSDFEAPDARRALPCFDEPDKKAVFQVNLGRRKDMTSISNMPQTHTDVEMADTDEYVWDVYEDSVKMSTYLLAFVVSEFEYRQSIPTSNDVRFRIWSRKEAIDQTEYAADIGPKILEYYEKYFDVPYPLPKQDMIAIPDFSAGAMENWGLITYRETALLYEDGVTSTKEKEYIRTVIAHELAHQWFGNLVTMKWWTE